MRKINNNSFKLFLPAALLLIALAAEAQKLPNVQETSIRAQANIKIDGNAIEWNKQFLAYNKATGISYIISNDDDNLYLLVLPADRDIVNKIIHAGLTFIIHGSGQTTYKNGIAIIFPFLYKDAFPFTTRPIIAYADNAKVKNKVITDKAKDIRVAGIKGVKDTISIYNQEGIKVVALFDKKEVFTYELAIPLKYLELSVNEPKPFAYTIRLNGTPNYPGFPKGSELVGNQMHAFGHVRQYWKIEGGISKISVVNNNLAIEGPNAAIVGALINPTYFSGEYTLSK